MEWKCMEFVPAGSCRRKWLGLYQIIRNIISANLEISLVVIRLEVTGLEKKNRLAYILYMFEGRGKKGQ